MDEVGAFAGGHEGAKGSEGVNEEDRAVQEAVAADQS